jgi:hypothetical protein
LDEIVRQDTANQCLSTGLLPAQQSNLFAAIDAEEARAPRHRRWFDLGGRISEFLSSLGYDANPDTENLAIGFDMFGSNNRVRRCCRTHAQSLIMKGGYASLGIDFGKYSTSR